MKKVVCPTVTIKDVYPEQWCDTCNRYSVDALTVNKETVCRTGVDKHRFLFGGVRVNLHPVGTSVGTLKRPER